MRALPRPLRFKDMQKYSEWFTGPNWAYPIEKQQGFWRAVGFSVLLFILLQIFQVVFTPIVYLTLLHQPFSSFQDGSAFPSPAMTQSVLIAMFPAVIPTVFLGLYFSKFGLPNRQGALPLQWRKMGILGWVLLFAAFIVSMFVLLNFIYWVFGFDPSRGSGLVEQTMMELAKNPWLFAYSLPSIVLGAPLSEELIFRGVLFAGLAASPVGRTGAVIITAALWSLAHAGPAPWVNVGLIFVMGLTLGVLLLRFGSLWVTIACHTAWNAANAFLLYVVGLQQ
jgi:uncharacterized protein